MVIIGEASEPSPPDIRAKSRLTSNACFAVNDKEARRPQWSDASSTAPAKNKALGLRSFIVPLTTTLVILAVLSAVATFATSTSTATSRLNPHSVPTYFATKSNTTRHGTGTPSAGRERAGILALFKLVATWAVSTTSSALGYDLVPHTHGHVKREKVEMNGQHIAMACMIPVLVALSGIFAGLTLG